MTSQDAQLVDIVYTLALYAAAALLVLAVLLGLHLWWLGRRDRRRREDRP